MRAWRPKEGTSFPDKPGSSLPSLVALPHYLFYEEHQTKGILQRFLKILKWGYVPPFGEPSGSRSLALTGRQSQSPRALRGLIKFQALKGAHTVDSSQRLNQCFLNTRARSRQRKQEVQENNIQLIVARSNTTKPFDFAEKALVLGTFLVKLCVIRPGFLRVVLRRNDRPQTTFFRNTTCRHSTIGLIHQQFTSGSQQLP